MWSPLNAESGSSFEHSLASAFRPLTMSFWLAPPDIERGTCYDNAVAVAWQNEQILRPKVVQYVQNKEYEDFDSIGTEEDARG